MRGARGPLLAGGAAMVLVLSGCGGDDYTNKLRPPEPVIVSAFVSNHEVSISPAALGAGPIRLIVTNQSRKPQEIAIATAGNAAGTRRKTMPIGSGDTATLAADVRTGTYSIAASGSGIRPATLQVGVKRPSSQNDLQQP